MVKIADSTIVPSYSSRYLTFDSNVGKEYDAEFQEPVP